MTKTGLVPTGERPPFSYSSQPEWEMGRQIGKQFWSRHISLIIVSHDCK